MPPSAHGVKVVSIGMFAAGNRPIAWRGPMLHKALRAVPRRRVLGRPRRAAARPAARHRRHRHLGRAAAAQRRARSWSRRRSSPPARWPSGPARSPSRPTRRIAGVIENMAGLPCPHCGEMVDVFGSGGGQAVAEALSALDRHRRCRCWARCRSTPGCARAATPAARWCSTTPTRPRGQALRAIADRLSSRARGLVGRPLGISPDQPLAARLPRAPFGCGQVVSTSYGAGSPYPSASPLPRRGAS